MYGLLLTANMTGIGHQAYLAYVRVLENLPTTRLATLLPWTGRRFELRPRRRIPRTRRMLAAVRQPRSRPRRHRIRNYAFRDAHRDPALGYLSPAAYAACFTMNGRAACAFRRAPVASPACPASLGGHGHSRQPHFLPTTQETSTRYIWRSPSCTESMQTLSPA